MLKVGQLIVSDGEEWTVLELLNQKNHTPRVRIKVEKATARMETYLTVGKEYVLRQNRADVWVVPKKQCKRTTSQVILYDFDNRPGINIDS
jgi:hypothetical protein